MNDLYNTLNTKPFLIAGPCVIESEDLCVKIASDLQEFCSSLGVTYIFKSSFDKANRTSVSSFRGLGKKEAFRVLEKVRNFCEYVTTDAHETKDMAYFQDKTVDIIQIPAFLCRQTDLVVSAAETGKIVNVKKGQFLTGNAMSHVLEKIKSTGNEKVMLTERGSMFGMNDLVVDFRNVWQMSKMGVPVVMDCTHSRQVPNSSSSTGGQDVELTGLYARSSALFGAKGLFLETHTDPSKALSDASTVVPLDVVKETVESFLKVSGI
tara:strand:+ start:253 stop:1047 length:795 start_codon:yes stop_codon:yes gene_type:complete